MILPPQQRRLLGAFIRAHRERCRPVKIGLAAPMRRRTPGLRREEVAELCGMSPTWYTWIEQGRDISVSAAALGRLAAALRLTPAERGYLFELARQRDPGASASRPAGPAPVGAEMQGALDSMQGPAYLLDRLWCALAWNGLAFSLFGDWLSSPSRSLLDFMFIDPRSKQLVPDWTERARRISAEFRSDTGRYPEDAEVQAAVERLQRESDRFSEFWEDHSVLGREGGARRFIHPVQGPKLYQQVTLIPANRPDSKLVMLVEEAAPPAKPQKNA